MIDCKLCYCQLELTDEENKVLNQLSVPIPNDEVERIQVLRQTKLLDSDSNEESFDRFTMLAKRLMNVPIASISLVDLNRQWFKSTSGLGASEIPRDISICSYTVLPESPDVFVVEDLTKDPRFANNPMVIGPPFLRFYAGAASIVGNVKVGGLCCADTKPREVSAADRQNLLDLGEVISSIIRERREVSLGMEYERAKLMLDMMHNIRTPLLAVSAATQEFESGKEDISTSLRAQRINNTNFEACLQDLKESKDRLLALADSTLALGEAIINMTGVRSNEVNDDNRRNGTECNLLGIIHQVRSALSLMTSDSSVQWLVDDSELSKGRHRSYPDQALYILMSSINQLLGHFKRIEVRIGYNKAEAQAEDLFGRFLIDITADNNNDNLITEESDGVTAKKELKGDLNFNSFNFIVRDIGGESIINSIQGLENDVSLRFEIPCFIDDSRALYESNPEAIKDKLTQKSLSRLPSVTALQKFSTILKVLVVDDSVPVQKSLKRWLEGHGCVVALASNGKVGLKLMREERFDITLMDFLMPVMLGLEAMKGFEDWRKEDRQTNNINDDMLIIGMSTSASEREQADGFTYGMHVYASKPFDLELLEIILEKRRNHKTIEDCTREICGMATVAPKQSTQEQCDDSKIAETGRKSSRRDLLRFFRFRSNKVIPIG